MSQDMSGRVAEHRGLAESLARKLANSRKARHAGAEFDDLEQEGLLAIWQCLERGVPVGKCPIVQRMKDYIRFVGRQGGQSLPECEVNPQTGEFVDEDPVTGKYIGACPQHIPYDAMLPLDDFRLLERSGQEG